MPNVVLTPLQQLLLKLALQVSRGGYQARREYKRQQLDLAKSAGPNAPSNCQAVCNQPISRSADPPCTTTLAYPRLGHQYPAQHGRQLTGLDAYVETN